MLDHFFDRFYLWLGHKIYAFVSQDVTVSAYRKQKFQESQRLSVINNKLCPIGSETIMQIPYMDDLFEIIYHRQY